MEASPPRVALSLLPPTEPRAPSVTVTVIWYLAGTLPGTWVTSAFTLPLSPNDLVNFVPLPPPSAGCSTFCAEGAVCLRPGASTRVLGGAGDLAPVFATGFAADAVCCG